MSIVVGFDLDLTLVDSADGIAATFARATKGVGAIVDPDELRPLIGLPLEETMRRFVRPQAVDEAVRLYREYFPSVGAPATSLMPGAAEAVDAVRRRGGRAVIVSAKVESAVRAVLDHVKLEVDDVVGDRFGEGKGDALREIGAQAHVGDHPNDMVGARSAGAFAIGVTTGGHDDVALREAGADVVLADLLDFRYWFDDHLAAAAATIARPRVGQ
ncbi:MAG TPA: HAD family hydrolase [Jiangellaceae bacterium]